MQLPCQNHKYLITLETIINYEGPMTIFDICLNASLRTEG